MTKMRVQQLVIGLAGLWAGLVGVRLMTSEPPQEVPLRWTSTRQPAAEQALPGGQEWRVQSLDPPTRDQRSIPGRNIFAAGSAALLVKDLVKPAVKKKSPHPVPSSDDGVMIGPPAPPEPTPEERAEEEARRRRERAVAQLKEQMAQYRYLGYLTRDGEQHAFLGKGREIYILRAGDKLENTVVLASVSAASVTLRAAESNLETVLQLKKESGGGDGDTPS